MMRTTRRAMMLGSLATPTLAAMPQWRWPRGERSALVFDKSLAAGLRFEAAGRVGGASPLAITGDRVRFTRTILEDRPALLAGLTRSADSLMVEEIAAELGYHRILELHGLGGICSLHAGRLGWESLSRTIRAAHEAWIEALAHFAARPAGEAVLPPPPRDAPLDKGLVVGWIMARA